MTRNADCASYYGMAIHLTIETSDPEVEAVIQFMQDHFSALDVYDRAEIVKRAAKWLEMEKEGGPGAVPSTVRLSVLRVPVSLSQ